MKKIYSATIFILFTFMANSQEILHDIVERVNHSTYIFEGQVIRSDCYWNSNHDFIYTSLTVEIMKIFKGNLQCGQVEIIAEGGNVNDTILEITHNLALRKGQLGVFMCVETDRELPAIDYYPESNPQKLQVKFNDQGYIQYFNDGVNMEVVDWQFSLDSLAQVYNLMELYTQLTLIDCNSQPLAGFHTDRKIALARAPIPQPNNSPHIVNLNATTSTGKTIFVGMQNPQITGTTQKYFEFDITLSDNADSAYFVGINLTIQYDTLSFPPLIVNSANDNIFIDRLPLLQDTNTYPSISLTDYQSNRDQFVIFFHYNVFGVPLNYVDLTLVPTPAAHVRMKIIDCSRQSYISFNYTTYNPFAKFSIIQNAFPGTLHDYDAISYGNSLFCHGCNLLISNVSPLSVRGGVGDSITITGNGFGNTRGNGKIYFANADDGGMSYQALDSADYGPWNDSIITFNIPGIVDSIDQHNLMRGIPGSGFIMLKTNVGTDSIYYFGNPVTVNYSIISTIIRTTPPLKYRSDLVNFYNYSGGGYRLRPDISFTRSDSMYAVLKVAIHDWVCETGVNFDLSDSIVALNGSAHEDSINIIQFGTPDDSNAITQTFIWRFPEINCMRTYNKGFDMIVDSSLLMAHKIYADTGKCNDVPAGKYDLYANLLHEFGHAVGLNHVNVLSSIMWEAQVPGALGPDRKVWLHKDHPTVNGGNYMKDQSQDPTISTCSTVPMMSLLSLSDCDTVRSVNILGCLNGVDEVDQDLIESLFPNPTSHYLMIEFQSEDIRGVSVSVMNITGSVLINVQSISNLSSYSRLVLDVGDLQPGIYFCRLMTKNKTEAFKFVKQ